MEGEYVEKVQREKGERARWEMEIEPNFDFRFGGIEASPLSALRTHCMNN